MDDISNAPAPLWTYRDVTPEWLTQALSISWPGVRVAAVRRGEPFGFKKNKFRIEVEYAQADSGLPPRFIVKGNFPGENDPSTGSAWAMASELRSIRDIAPLVAAPAIPQCFYTHVDDAVSSLVMEDLTLAAAVFFNTFSTLDLGQAMAFVDAFARMHASTWNSPAFRPGGTMDPQSFAGQNRRVINESYFPTFFTPDNWNAYVARPRGRAMPSAYQDLSRAKSVWNRMWSVMRQAATVVIHGDEHLGNLYVTADGAPGAIDWFARPEHWPIGIAYFMVCALDAIDRRNWERALISHYVTRLGAYGVSHPPALEDAWFLYRVASFYPLMTWLNNSAVWQPEAVNTANTVRAAIAVMDHDVFGLLGV